MRAITKVFAGETRLPALKLKKGDLVLVDENGKATKYEIISLVEPRGHHKYTERLYEVKNVNTGAMKTIAEEDVLRLATPVDSAAVLFEKTESKAKTPQS
jgi:hypothetical protein